MKPIEHTQNPTERKWNLSNTNETYRTPKTKHIEHQSNINKTYQTLIKPIEHQSKISNNNRTYWKKPWEIRLILLAFNWFDRSNINRTIEFDWIRLIRLKIEFDFVRLVTSGNLIQDSRIQVCLNDFKLPQYVQNIINLQIPMNRVVCNSIIKSLGLRINLLFFWQLPAVSAILFISDKTCQERIWIPKHKGDNFEEKVNTENHKVLHFIQKVGIRRCNEFARSRPRDCFSTTL